MRQFLLARFVPRIVGISIRNRGIVVFVAALVFCASAWFAATRFAITTDTGQLISSQAQWRKLEMAFDKAFPARIGTIVVVVDGQTPERTEQAAADLALKISALENVVISARRPDAGRFFVRNGLLFLSPAEVAATTVQLIKAQPFLGALAADPSLRGLMSVFSAMAMGVEQKETSFAALADPLASVAAALDDVIAGHQSRFSWRELISGEKPKPRDLRKLIIIKPVLDYAALEPGGAATAAIRSAVRDLGLGPDNGVRVRLTGPVPLADEEFATVADGALLNGLATLAVVLLILKMALHSLKIIAAVLICLAAGLTMTAALGLAMVQALNLISVAFAVLFVGLGVDFGLQFCVRYREERHFQADTDIALVEAAAKAGNPLALAAASTALGFFAFLPTEYRGLSELGLIAGVGMLIAFATSITLLPVLLSLFNPPPEPAAMGYRWLAPLEQYLASHRRLVLVATAILSIGALPALAKLRFDFNPINLRNPRVESVATFLDLMRDPATSPNSIDILSASLPDATQLAGRLEALPEVEQVLTLASFVPGDQDAKLELIQDAALLLDPTLNPTEIKPAPTDAQIAEAMAKAAAALKQAAQNSGPPAGQALHLADALAKLADATPQLREKAAQALLPGLRLVLDQTRAALQAEKVTLADLPSDLTGDWTSADGRSRIEVFPKGDSNSNEVLRRFVAAVRSMARDATGAPVSIQESGRTIVHALILAGFWAFGSITLLLLLVLRRVIDVALTLVPLLLAGVVTLEICGLIDLPLNFANIIALPLLLGVGVAFKVYFVMAWRAGETQLLQSSLTRAVFCSALTTATAFGSLWMSSHPGTSSMGKLLALSLACTLAAAVLFQPVLMGPPRAGKTG